MRSASPEIIFRFYACGTGAEQISAQIAAWRFRMSVSSAERVIVMYLFSRVRHAARKAPSHTWACNAKNPSPRSICHRRDFVICFSFTMRSRSQPCCYSARYPNGQKPPTAVLRESARRIAHQVCTSPRFAVGDLARCFCEAILQGNFTGRFPASASLRAGQLHESIIFDAVFRQTKRPTQAAHARAHRRIG